MPSQLIKIMAGLLLLVQVAMATASGRVICIPVRECDSHRSVEASVCGHCDHHSDPHADGSATPQTPEQPERHTECDLLATGRQGGCGCHVHVPVPSDEQVPSTPRSDVQHLKTILPPAIVVQILDWTGEDLRVMPAQLRPPDESMLDQSLALKSTQLLI